MVNACLDVKNQVYGYKTFILVPSIMQQPSFRLSDGVILFIVAIILGILGFGGYALLSNLNNDVAAQDTLQKILTTKDFSACDQVIDETAKKTCFTKAYPLAASLESCPHIPFEDIKTACTSYAQAIENFKASGALSQRMPYSYTKKEMELFFKDGSKKKIVADVADTTAMRVQGLSYKEEMREDEGMLFTFGGGKAPAFHMKDMVLALDILFLDKDGEVVNSYVGVPSCVPTPNDCPLLYPANDKAIEVLEIPPQSKEVVKVVAL